MRPLERKKQNTRAFSEEKKRLPLTDLVERKEEWGGAPGDKPWRKRHPASGEKEKPERGACN